VDRFEHLVLPKTNIELPKRGKGGGGGGTHRSDRSSHGRLLLSQIVSISQEQQKTAPFRLNPKLIFKIKLRPKSNLQESELSPLGLTLLSQEPKAKKAIVVFTSEEELTKFTSRLEVYSGIKESPYEYGNLDAIEELVPLEPSDRLGQLLELEPLAADEIAALDLELWHTGNRAEMSKLLDDYNEIFKGWTDNSVMHVSDRYVGEYLCLARIKADSEVLEHLLNECFVKEIDRRPKPNFEKPAEYNIPLSDLPEVNSLPDTDCGVLVIDSGVQRGHPLIAPVLGDAEVFPDPAGEFISGGADDGDEKTNGHGTGVSGIAIYGDVSQCIKNRSFQPTAWLFSARVTNSNNEYHPDYLLENQLDEAINYFTNNYGNCKVINISLGDSRLTFRDGQKQFRLAAKIDEIAYNLQHKNLVFIISAGNYALESSSGEELKIDYPKYLLNEDARIIEPATSAIALTVGSLSLGKGCLQFPEDARRNAIAKMEGYPSPFTRSGFGVDGAIKPDVVDFGGDLAIDGDRLITNDAGVSIMTLAKNVSGSLFRAYCGTSFAAPCVANIAAQLFTYFPNASSNLIRALIVNSATLPQEIPQTFQAKSKDTEKLHQQLKIYGYGQPNLLQATYSAKNYVVLLEDNQQIPVGSFQIFEIPPLPDFYLTGKGKRRLSIALAFDPPTRPTRGDSYLGVTMEFHLLKNLDIDSVQRAFVNADKAKKNNTVTDEIVEISLKELKKRHGSGIIVDLFPGSNLRKKGTVQRGRIEISDRATGYSDRPLYLVVSCSRKWAREGEIDMQRYALVVSIDHSDPEIDLYNQLRLKTRISQRIRI
jgi:hypothetical protein